MSDDLDNAPKGPRHASGWDREDRESIVNREIRLALMQLGVDLRSPDSIEDFREFRAWGKQEMLRQQQLKENRRKAIWSSIVGFLIAAFSASISWLVTRR